MSTGELEGVSGAGSGAVVAEGGGDLWRLVLTVKSGADAGKRAAADKDVVTVGKLPDCDLVLTDATVSRRHLRISRAGPGRWVLADLGSTNGTFVRDARIQEAAIEAGTVIRAGEVEIAFAPHREPLEVPAWPEDHLGAVLGRSAVMRRLFGLAARIAQTEATVLIEGETGTGKGLLARAIHQRSERAAGPWVVVDCGNVHRHLVESELFGHEKGAFTGAYARRTGAFELAGKGTVFVDELGELPLELQPKLLRVLDAREVRRIGAPAATPVDIRVIAASRRDLAREVERGAFREDLFFRVSVVTLRIPPLRDRAEDIPLLAERFTEELARSRGVRAPRLDARTMDRLTSHDWPGNVRELRNVLERAVLLSAIAGDRLELGELAPQRAAASADPRGGAQAFDPGLSFSEAKESFLDAKERAYVAWLLGRHDGNVSAAARDARMDRKYLHKLIKKHGL